MNTSTAAGFGDRFVLTLITDDPALARSGVMAGIDRIGLDLEIIGKNERQGGMGTRISAHDIDRLPLIRETIGDHPLFVRVNPIHEQSPEEVERVIGGGATHVMLPYFHRPDEARRFADLVAGRATTVLLVETAAALYFIEELVCLPGIDEIHVGLTDLKLSMKIRSRFETLTSWMLERASEIVHAVGLPLHVGGVARIDDASLPIPSDLLNAQYPRLGATGALVSRSFTSPVPTAQALTESVRRFRESMNHWGAAGPEEWELQRRALKQFVVDAAAEGRSLP
ncbi:aldolase/citrate lyase family protein [Methylotetracoccus oryzae]|uniref:aldolase/citrate lyase family protein n=1 Tax=Methylotetracoccus oryzae TaxID=1919059 RepID=UPI00111B87CE|nr:aldolase/citrate lyase family protein [Methylotetracoccus oryzae]